MVQREVPRLAGNESVLHLHSRCPAAQATIEAGSYLVLLTQEATVCNVQRIQRSCTRPGHGMHRAMQKGQSSRVLRRHKGTEDVLSRPLPLVLTIHAVLCPAIQAGTWTHQTRQVWSSPPLVLSAEIQLLSPLSFWLLLPCAQHSSCCNET